MADDQNKLPSVTEDNSIQAQLARAQIKLPQHEFEMLVKYVESGKHQLSPDTCAKFFELYLNGSDCKEIYRLNKVFPYEAILWASIKFRWDEEKDGYIVALNLRVRDKVMKAQLETTNLMADLLTATSKKHGDKLKKYIQSGDDKDLQGSLSVESIQSLLRLSEGLLKITGQDRVTKSVHENKQSLDVHVKTSIDATSSNLSTEDAAKVLAILADAKRKSEQQKK